VKPGFPRDGIDGNAHGSAPRLRARVRTGIQVLAVLVPLALAVLVPLACANETSLAGAGEECFAATDCLPGLVCVPQRGGSRLCSSDLTQVAGRPPPEAGVADAEGGADGPTEGSVTDGPDPDTSMPDTSMPDTSVADAAGGG